MNGEVKCPSCGQIFKRILMHYRQSAHCASRQQASFLPPQEPGSLPSSSAASTSTNQTKATPLADDPHPPPPPPGGVTQPASPLAEVLAMEEDFDVRYSPQEYSPRFSKEGLRRNGNNSSSKNTSINDSSSFMEDNATSEDHTGTISNLDQQGSSPPTNGGKSNSTSSTGGGSGDIIQALGMEFSLSLGQECSYPMNDQVKHITSMIPPSDKVLAKLHHMADQTGAPRYLVDSILATIKEETLSGNFRITDCSVTQRKALMKRLEQSIKAEPVEEIPITLECGLSTTLCRFPFNDRVQRHLMGPVFADLDNINLPIDPAKPFQQDDPTLLPPLDYSDLTNGEWYRRCMERYQHLTKTGKHPKLFKESLSCPIGPSPTVRLVHGPPLGNVR